MNPTPGLSGRHPWCGSCAPRSRHRPQSRRLRRIGVERYRRRPPVQRGPVARRSDSRSGACPSETAWGRP